jgi:hypothetical protein
MQRHTIVNAFKDSGVYPTSAKAGITKMRMYNKAKRSITEVDDELDLPRLPPIQPEEIWTTAATVRSLADRDPTQFSDNSKQVFSSTMKAVDIQLQKAHLTSMEHANLQQRLRSDLQRRSKSRRSIQKGGPAPRVKDLRQIIQARDEREQGEALRKAERALSQAINKQKRHLITLGIQARKDEKARFERLRQYQITGQLPPTIDEFPIRQPDKDPTALEQELCTPEGHPGLLQAVRQAQVYIDSNDGDGEVTIRVGNSQGVEAVQDYMESSPPPLPELQDSSDVESHAGSIDSIARNADFISFT